MDRGNAIGTIRSPHPVELAPSARATDLRTRAPHVALAAAPPGGLQEALEQIETLQLQLAASRHESVVARQQVALLEEANTGLKRLALLRERDIARVRHSAYHDELTGLPNRTLLLDRLNQALMRAGRQQKQLALLLLDLDGFKDINDKLGHAIGDALLRCVAKRLQSCMRGGDTVCRYGGDEFVLLLPEIADQKHAVDVARKVSARLATPYHVEAHSIATTASIGVAVYPDDGMSQNDLIRQADVAMYRAKTRRISAKDRPEPESRR